MFKEEKIAQMAAYFLKMRGGSMAVVKLMKLLYLADRYSLEQYGHPISNAPLASMEHGPVISPAINFAKGDFMDGSWCKWIGPRKNHELSLSRNFESDKELGLLSKADLMVMKTVFEEYGHLDRWEVVKKTHELPEYQDPGKSSLPIAYYDIFKALDYDDQDADELDAELREVERNQRRLMVG